MIRYVFNILKNCIKKKRCKWNITDTVVEIESVVNNQHICDFEDITKDSFTCIRSYTNTCIYVKEECLNKLLENNTFCYDNLVNITELAKHVYDSNCIPKVSNKTVPYSVDIKEIKICKCNDFTVYIVRVISLSEKDKLFKSLVNLQFLKDKYNI